MEFLQVMGEQVEQEKLNDHMSSILIDETTDIPVINEMVINAHFIDELTNGCAETIEAALVVYLEEQSIPLSRLVGFGSDSSSVINGKH